MSLDQALERQKKVLRHGKTNRTLANQLEIETDYKRILNAIENNELSEDLRKEFSTILNEKINEEFNAKTRLVSKGEGYEAPAACALAKTSKQKQKLERALQKNKKRIDKFDEISNGQASYIMDIVTHATKREKERVRNSLHKFLESKYTSLLEEIEYGAKSLIQNAVEIKRLIGNYSHSQRLKQSIEIGEKKQYECLLYFITTGQEHLVPITIPIAKKYNDLQRLENAVLFGRLNQQH